MAGEWEDENIVFVELCGVPSGQLFPPDAGNLQGEILGIASDRPVMQINGHSFAGQYEDTLGTYLLMEKKSKAEQGSKGGESGKSSQDDVVEYFCKTDKKLVMQPAVLVEKMVMAAVEPCTEKDTELTAASSTPQTPVATT